MSLLSLSLLLPERFSAHFLTTSCCFFPLSVLFAMISKNLVAVQNPGRKKLRLSLRLGGGALAFDSI